MAEEQKSQQTTASQQTQNYDQLQTLLKQTMKENKSLLNKNTKLETKYVELFKQHKALKKDHTLFVAFLTKFFNGNSNSETSRQLFQEATIGQYQIGELQKISEIKQSVFKDRIEQLEKFIEQKQKQKKFELEQLLKEKREELTRSYQEKMKDLKQLNNKQANSFLKELQSLRKTSKIQSDELGQLKNSLQVRNNELSKVSKQKLKLQHHLNNIRKKQFAQELNPDKEKQNEKQMNQRNQFLSLRQQVETLMIKRDQLKRQVKEKDDIIAQERRKNIILQDEIKDLKKIQGQLDEKYELIRECTIQELENLIITHHFDSAPNQSKPASSSPPQAQFMRKAEDKVEENEEIQRQYLKNILIRYIKAQTSGAFDQALMLLEIIGTILKLDHESSQALQSYKSKRRQWWYIKY